MKVIIYGLGDFAELMYFYLQHDSSYQVEAFTADEQFINNKESFCGKPLLAFENIEDFYPPQEYSMLVCIGYKKMRNRKILFDKAISKGYKLINYIHSSVKSMNLELGCNNIIFPNVTIEPGVTIGNNNIIWSDTLLGHGAAIGNHIYIAAKVLVSGQSKIEDLSFLGNSVSMIDGLNISTESFLVAGSIHFKNTEPYTMYMGSPAKKVRKHEKNGIIIRR
jgi:sugar O-acyltransferase (sialic acid O-acetyltransferase NeuD family)